MEIREKEERKRRKKKNPDGQGFRVQQLAARGRSHARPPDLVAPNLRWLVGGMVNFTCAHLHSWTFYYRVFVYVFMLTYNLTQLFSFIRAQYCHGGIYSPWIELLDFTYYFKLIVVPLCVPLAINHWNQFVLFQIYESSFRPTSLFNLMLVRNLKSLQ